MTWLLTFSFPHYLAFSRTISLFSALFPALFGKIFRTIFHFFPHSTRIWGHLSNKKVLHNAFSFTLTIKQATIANQLKTSECEHDCIHLPTSHISLHNMASRVIAKKTIFIRPSHFTWQREVPLKKATPAHAVITNHLLKVAIRWRKTSQVLKENNWKKE